MTLQGAQEYSRKHGLIQCDDGDDIILAQARYDAIGVIEDALDNGYQLCRVDEVIDTMNRRALFTDNIHPEVLLLGAAIGIVREACK